MKEKSRQTGEICVVLVDDGPTAWTVSPDTVASGMARTVTAGEGAGELTRSKFRVFNIIIRGECVKVSCFRRAPNLVAG